MSGLFSTLHIGTRGMMTQQTAIDVTSHNIANAGTKGYSRQTAIIETSTPLGGGGIENGSSIGQMGTGSQVSAIKRIRDTFLDYQVREETSTLGTYSARNGYLANVEAIMNEPSDTNISKLMSNFFNAWNALGTKGNAATSTARTTVEQQSNLLANSLNQMYTKLQSLKTNTQTNIQEDVFTINSKLEQIDKLNQQIMSVKVAGLEPNDLMDKRDLLLDELSSKFNISVDRKQFEGNDVKPGDIPAGVTQNIVSSVPNDVVSRFSYIYGDVKAITNAATGEVTIPINYYKNGDITKTGNSESFTIKIQLGDGGANGDYASLSTDQKKALDTIIQKKVKEIDQNRVLWADKTGTAYAGSTIDLGTINLNDGSAGTGSLSTQVGNVDSNLKLFTPSSGEVKGYTSVQADIVNSIEQINKLAKALAFSVNAIQSGMTDVTQTSDPNKPAKDFMPFFVNKDIAKYNPDGTMSNLDAILSSECDITAGNISINQEISHDVMKIKTRTHDNLYKYESDNILDGVDDGARALEIAGIQNKLMKIEDIGMTINSRADLFGVGGNSFEDSNNMKIKNNTNGMKMDTYYQGVIDKMASQKSEADRIVGSQEKLLEQFESSREQVSGVSSDEEIANLIQYQHAYQANAKIIATVDELLDVVVNGLKK